MIILEAAANICRKLVPHVRSLPYAECASGKGAPAHADPTHWVTLQTGRCNHLKETKRGSCYLLVVRDYFTKWPEAFPMPEMEAAI
ncbi:hypothetical protein T10_12520 [Trichinella papuae]|uniref:Retrovirus-related Pol polyprotein from transposon n=1 Tax=Trichinella papuae TaxID=268474 RepID=A0A0V1MVN6_9BILA|nr:hypothetical protein T10_12520 [Trichinella papuae]